MKTATVNSGISLLNFDGTLQKQPMLQEYSCEWINFSDLRDCNGYCYTNSLRKIQLRLISRNYKYITMIGNGNYHYITYLLLADIQQPFSLVLFDHHTDLVQEIELPFLSCGSWVSTALKNLPLLQHVVIIGANPPNRHQTPPDNVTIITEQEVSRLSAAEMLKVIRSVVPDQPLYISVDKDVLDQEHVATNWDQGSMTLTQLLDMIREIKEAYPIIGMDVCGELPLPAEEAQADKHVQQLKKNELANKAIIDMLLTGKPIQQQQNRMVFS